MLRLGNVAAAFACSLMLATGFATPALAEEPLAPPSSEAATPTPTPEPASAEPSAPTDESPTATPTPTPEPTSTEPSAPTDESPDATSTPAPTTEPRLQADAAVMPASIVSPYEFGENSLCPGDAKDATVTNTSGAVSIDLSSLTGYSSIGIGSNATTACRSEITGLSFRNRPESLTAITIGDDAFAQVDFGTANTLTSVSFPAGITELRIGSRAFQQDTGVGANTLAEVSFPDSLEILVIGESAFAQTASAAEADNALTAVTLHARTGNLSIAYGAFQQVSELGSNALATVTFDLLPRRTDDDDSLVIGGAAFSQLARGANALTSISFPSGYREVQFGISAFAQRSLTGATSLAAVNFDAAVELVDVGESAFMQTAQTHTSLTAVRFPDAVADLYVADLGFAQDGNSGTSLTTVAFPKASAMVSLGRSAFSQTSQDGACTLSTLSFPDTLEIGLAMDSYAFEQSCAGRAALATVSFPRQSPMLYIGPQAFSQNATPNALTSVVFPTSVDALTIRYDAFAQSDVQVLRRILFPFSSSPSNGIATDESIVSDPSTVDWQWFGPDGANIGSWTRLVDSSIKRTSANLKIAPEGIPANTNQVLTGYRTLDLANLDGSTPTRYVYRDGRSLSTPLSRQTDVVGPADSSGGWTTTLPRPSWTGRTFRGWCSTEVQGNTDCTGTLTAAGARVSLAENSTFWAVWNQAAAADELANTGAENTAPLALLATALIILGTGLILTRRTA